MNILTLDIETSPHEAYAFNVWQANIAGGQIINPTYMLSFAAKWHGDKKSETVYRSCYDDDMHDVLWEMLNRADMIVSYNGDKFDMRHINREFVERGYYPTKPLASVDLLKVVKKQFLFPHNRLDYVANRLMGVSKLETGGFDLWPAFMRKDPAALKTMKKYNIQDVIITEKLYDRLLPWITNHPYIGSGDTVIDDAGMDYECPTCQSHKIDTSNQRRTRCFAIRVNNCEDCGTWFDGKRKKLT